MEVRRLKHHRIGGGVDEAEWTVGDDFLVADLASAALEMRLQTRKAERTPPTVQRASARRQPPSYGDRRRPTHGCHDHFPLRGRGRRIRPDGAWAEVCRATVAADDR
jgi:hypothetical protein